MNGRNSTEVTLDCLAWINEQLRHRIEERRRLERLRPRRFSRVRAYVAACAAGVMVTVARLFEF